jgi:hypothetical protein
MHVWSALGPGWQFLTALSGFVAGCALVLRVRDLVRRGFLRRRAKDLSLHPTPVMLAYGLIPCPECAEAVLPWASRCPYCESLLSPREPAPNAAPRAD